MSSLTSKHVLYWLTKSIKLADDMQARELQLQQWLRGDGNMEPVVVDYYKGTARIAKFLQETGEMLADAIRNDHYGTEWGEDEDLLD